MKTPLTLADVTVTWQRGNGEPRRLSGETLARLIWVLEHKIASENWAFDIPEVVPLDDPVLCALSVSLDDAATRMEAEKLATRFAESCRVETNGA